jgi:hypothetical protein
MMAVAARRPFDAIGQVDQLVRRRHLDSLGLHIRLDKDQVAMSRGLSGAGRLAKSRQRWGAFVCADTRRGRGG